MMRHRTLLVLALALTACRDPHPRPDASCSADAAQHLDLAQAPDMATAGCIKCDAVLNPCPALGLECDPDTRCCVAPALCVPQFKQCLAPAVCCPGLKCVGGACAKVSP